MESSRGWIKGQSADKRGRPRITFDDLVEKSAGVIALTGPASGPIGAKIQMGEISTAARKLSEWKELFGDRLAVEVQIHHAGGNESALASALIDLAERENPRFMKILVELEEFIQRQTEGSA